MLATLDADGDEEDAALEAIRDLAADAPPGITAAVGGADAAGLDISTTIEGDLGRAELIAIPITLILLLFVFGGLVAASLPLFVGVVAVLGTFLSLFVIGSLTDVSVYSINLTTALGLGLAIDYSLFIVSRYREELRAGRSVGDAVVRAVETAGRTVAISALTVAVSLAALLVFPQYFLRSFAYAGIAVVLLAMVTSIVALPALLTVVGTRIDRLRIFPHRAPKPEHERLLVPQGPARHAPAAAGQRCRRRRPAAARLAVPAGQLRRARRPGAADERRRRASPTTSCATSFAGNAAETFPVVVDGVTAADAGAVDDLAATSRPRARPGRRPRGTYADGTVRTGRASAPSRPTVRLAVVPAIEMGSPTARRWSGTSATSTPRSTCRSAATRPASSTPSRRSGRGCRSRSALVVVSTASCCSCCRAACSCRSRRSSSTRSA